MRIGIGIGMFAVALIALTAPASAKPEEWSSQRFLDNAQSWGDIAFTIGPDSIQVSWSDLILGQETSKAVRDAADGGFDQDDKDGVVDEEEASNFLFVIRTTFENEFNKWVNQHEYSGIVLIDNAEPTEIEVSIGEGDVTGLTGAVDQETPISASLSALISFPNVDDYKDLHSVKLDLGKYYFQDGHEEQASAVAKDVSLAIEGADAWAVDADSVQPDCASENYAEGRILLDTEDVGCFTGRSGVLLAFTISGEGKAKNFLPGFDVVMALGVLLSAMYFVRRRA